MRQVFFYYIHEPFMMYFYASADEVAGDIMFGLSVRMYAGPS